MWNTLRHYAAPRRWQLTAALTVLALVPLGLLDRSAVPPNPFDGATSPTGWLWLLVFPAAGIALWRRPVPRAAWRDFAPYGLFLALATASLAWTPAPREGLGTLLRLLAPALVYLAVRAAQRDERVPEAAGSLASWWIALTALAFLAGHLTGYTFPDRLAAMGLAAGFAATTLAARSRPAAFGWGALALAVSVASGSRTASFVILVLVLVSPAVALPWRARGAAALVAVVTFGVALSIPAVHERWFTDSPGASNGSLADVLTFGDRLDTSGRVTVWSELAAECRADPLLGGGVGSANPRAAALGEGFSQPHNEYLRVFCDTGAAGSVLLWGFFLGVGWRAWQAVRVPGAPRTVPAAALLTLMGLVIFAMTDNVLTATLHYAAPAAVVFALSDAQRAAWVPPRLRRVRATAIRGPR